ncbi:hypothetical protein HNQ93_003931 [Hymenobacter luteus]|uniref:Uncharacterized protein n=2 Tax=Hymenobacter TaxID=89966 RepID=A0A7W9T5B6_9BACT|nr:MULTISPECIES: hypothetical protein [Hymenobacter]MBB4603389.1 hypothetical protein [Hymenobacter latericoloratus]MBB6061053.1 hypothetical protein [Hymenobacter luteus]
MADLHNPLFEDEKEFLERQKLEYERALMGEVEGIKAKTQVVSKYVAIGAGVLGGVWLLSKTFGGKKKRHALENDEEYARHQLGTSHRPRRQKISTTVDTAIADDLGFGTGHHQYDRGQTHPHAHERAHLAPEVYHTDADPFRPLGLDETAPYRAVPAPRSAGSSEAGASSVLASAVKAFLQSETGKLLMAQASAVLMAYIAKKAGDYLPILKNPDLASSGPVQTEPETKDIEFTYHHDDADAPHQPV